MSKEAKWLMYEKVFNLEEDCLLKCEDEDDDQMITNFRNYLEKILNKPNVTPEERHIVAEVSFRLMYLEFEEMHSVAEQLRKERMAPTQIKGDEELLDPEVPVRTKFKKAKAGDLLTLLNGSLQIELYEMVQAITYNDVNYFELKPRLRAVQSKGLELENRFFSFEKGRTLEDDLLMKISDESLLATLRKLSKHKKSKKDS